jgi:hypothetical protein
LVDSMDFSTFLPHLIEIPGLVCYRLLYFFWIGLILLITDES